MIYAIVYASAPAGIAAPCSAADLKVRLDSGNGEFEATQHEGLRVIVSNATQTSCTLPSLPALTLLDSKDRRLAIPATKPNPAPPSASIVVAPGASVAQLDVHGNVEAAEQQHGQHFRAAEHVAQPHRRGGAGADRAQSS